jgi:hypothetical protein
VDALESHRGLRDDVARRIFRAELLGQTFGARRTSPFGNGKEAIPSTVGRACARIDDARMVGTLRAPSWPAVERGDLLLHAVEPDDPPRLSP